MALKERLKSYLERNPGWIAKGQLCDLAREKTGATGEHTGRRLRELEVAGILEVKEVKHHAFYRYKGDPNEAQLQWFNSLPANA